MKPNGTGPLGKQDYGTPVELLEAVRHRFGGIDFDLAATLENRVCNEFISPEQDSLKTVWPIEAGYPGSMKPVRCWLNPPFANIAPWAKKCAEWASNEAVHKGSRLFFLVPASIGSNWWREHVASKARVLALSPRLTFVGCDDPYPKDCALCVYEPAWPLQYGMFEYWRWTDDCARNDTQGAQVDVL